MHSLDHKKPRRDWLLRLITTTALGMLIKLSATVAGIDKRLYGVEVTLKLIAPAAPRYSLLEKKEPIQSAIGFFIPGLLTKKEK